MNYRAASGSTTIGELRDALLNWENAGTITNIVAWRGAVIDASRDSNSKTLTQITMHEGSTFRDPAGNVTLFDGIRVPGDRRLVTIERGPGWKETYTAI